MKPRAEKEFKPAAPVVPAGATSEREFGWLLRRRELLMRAIAEMEQHELFPHLSDELVPNVPELLAWARDELGNVEAQLRETSAVLVPPVRHPLDRRLRRRSPERD